MRALTLAILLMAVILSAKTSDAHAVAGYTDPPPGTRLSEPPAELRVLFTENIDPAATRLTLIDQDGQAVIVPDTIVEPPRTAFVRLPPLPPGGYLAKWQTLSTADGHSTSGSWSFVVGEGDIIEATPASSTNFRIDAIIGKAITYLGLAIVLGGAAHATYVVPQVPPRSRARLRVIVIFGAVATLAGTVLFLYSQLRSSGLAPDVYFSTAFGRDLLVRATLAIAIVALSFPRTFRASLLLPAALAIAYIAVSSVHTHTVAYADPPWLGGILHTLHYGSMLLWSGGLVLLFLHLRWLPRDGTSGEEARAAARRFGVLASANVAIAVLTGAALYITLRGIDWQAALANPYSGTLAAHALLGAGMIGMGAANRWMHVPRLTREHPQDALGAFRTSVNHEAAVGLAILFLAAAVTNLQPPVAMLTESTSDDLAPPAASYVLNGTTYAVHLQVDPGPALGQSSNYTAHIFQKDTEATVEDAQAQLRFTHVPSGIRSDHLTLSPIGDGRYSTTGAYLTLAGDYTVVFSIQTPDVFLETTSFNLTLAAGPP